MALLTLSRRSEFFLPLLLHGRFVCQLDSDVEVLVRYKEHNPVEGHQTRVFERLYADPISKGLITRQAIGILDRLHEQVLASTQKSAAIPDGNASSQPHTEDDMELQQVLCTADKVCTKSMEHRLLFALLIYVFNVHHHPEVVRTSTPAGSGLPRNAYLNILSKVALELAHPSKPTVSLSEREVTLWTMVAIGAASTLSPWRLDIPFRSHLIEWMEDDQGAGGRDSPSRSVIHGSSSNQSSPDSLSTDKPITNLDKLTSCLRGYYLYGADKNTLRSLKHS
jgi:hypothetical protein